jgi:hypothetical protein
VLLLEVTADESLLVDFARYFLQHCVETPADDLIDLIDRKTAPALSLNTPALTTGGGDA